MLDDGYTMGTATEFRVRGLIGELVTVRLDTPEGGAEISVTRHQLCGLIGMLSNALSWMETEHAQLQEHIARHRDTG